MTELQKPAPLRLLLVGYGRMGQAIESLSADLGFDVVGRVDGENTVAGGGLDDRWSNVDVALDFSTGPAVAENLARLAELEINTVIGTTGWQKDEPALRALVEASDIGVVVAPNCAPGVNAFIAIVAHAASLLGTPEGFEPWIHESHHAQKRDAPSGTAIKLRAALGRGESELDIASTRAGAIPGTHTVGLDGPFETITLTHTTRDRRAFAQGALEAARWVHGRRGWFTMRHVLGLEREHQL